MGRGEAPGQVEREDFVGRMITGQERRADCSTKILRRGESNDLRMTRMDKETSKESWVFRESYASPKRGTNGRVPVKRGTVGAVLGAWLMHPAMAEVGEAGRWFVRLLMLAVVVAVVVMLVFRRNKHL